MKIPKTITLILSVALTGLFFYHFISNSRNLFDAIGEGDLQQCKKIIEAGEEINQLNNTDGHP